MSENKDATENLGSSSLLSGNIYVYRPTHDCADCAGVAYAADGDEIAWHVSSSYSWFQRDMGLIGECKHDKYQAKYPDGFKLIEVVGRESLQSHIDAGDISGLTFAG